MGLDVWGNRGLAPIRLQKKRIRAHAMLTTSHFRLIPIRVDNLLDMREVLVRFA